MQERDPCLAKQKHQTPVRLVKDVFVPSTQLSFQEPAGQGESGQCGPSVYASPAPTLDESLKSDRSLYPVRALRYYLDRTSDLRQNKQLVLSLH